MKNSQRWQLNSVVPFQHLNHGEKVLLRQGNNLPTLGLLLTRWILSHKVPLCLEIHYFRLWRLVFRQGFEVVDEPFQAWRGNGPLIVRISVELQLLHILEVDLITLGLEIDTPRIVVSLGQWSYSTCLCLKDSVRVTSGNELQIDSEHARLHGVLSHDWIDSRE